MLQGCVCKKMALLLSPSPWSGTEQRSRLNLDNNIRQHFKPSVTPFYPSHMTVASHAERSNCKRIHPAPPFCFVLGGTKTKEVVGLLERRQKAFNVRVSTLQAFSHSFLPFIYDGGVASHAERSNCKRIHPAPTHSSHLKKTPGFSSSTTTKQKVPGIHGKA